MAITLDILIIEIKRRLQQHRSDAAIPSRTDDLEGLVSKSINILCARATMNSRIRKTLTTSYAAVPLVSGNKKDLSTGWPTLYVQGLEYASQILLDGYPNSADYICDYAHFIAGTPRKDTPRCTTVNGELIFRTANNEDLTGVNVTINGAIFEPVINLVSGQCTLHDSLEEEFFDIVANEQISRSGAQQ